MVTWIWRKIFTIKIFECSKHIKIAHIWRSIVCVVIETHIAAMCHSKQGFSWFNHKNTCNHCAIYLLQRILQKKVSLYGSSVPVKINFVHLFTRTFLIKTSELSCHSIRFPACWNTGTSHERLINHLLSCEHVDMKRRVQKNWWQSVTIAGPLPGTLICSPNHNDLSKGFKGVRCIDDDWFCHFLMMQFLN